MRGLRDFSMGCRRPGLGFQSLGICFSVSGSLDLRGCILLKDLRGLRLTTVYTSSRNLCLDRRRTGVEPGPRAVQGVDLWVSVPNSIVL